MSATAVVGIVAAICTALSSILGAWIPATYAVYKTNTNLLYILFYFVLILIAQLAVIILLCWIMSQAYCRLVEIGSSEPYSSSKVVLSIVAMVLLLISFKPIIAFSTNLPYSTMAAVLYLSGNQQAVNIFYNAVDAQQEYAIEYFFTLNTALSPSGYDRYVYTVSQVKKRPQLHNRRYYG
ncbi:unnamed protein product [Adineta ricciae]|uniref:Uncharacterized protein n=1 Tax=Adineta ricciae TaxID=249248 RepID=A0A814UL05_ADIRI|nr:unnamed protein product [Adineta ricciae]CAF1173638.1 unnamed protein product [Adineta ricciae]